ncbi:MAG: RES domain-containing protein [Bacteroidales bacterium]|nr:RES domain-containing protein [Bacteroidales bacterium]
MIENIQAYILTIKELYKRIENLNNNFPEHYEDWIIKCFEPIKVYSIIGEGIYPIIERITVNKRVIEKNETIKEVDKLSYPPERCVKKYGRANLKNQSVFYGSFNFMTSIMEMKPDNNDLITISKWKLKNENEFLITCPMFLNQPTDGTYNERLIKLYNSFINELQRYPSSVADLIYEIHKFYANCFARKIESDNNQGYIFTALLADKIFNQFKDGIVEAILYPSTQENLRTKNIAIKKDLFDRKYEIFETIEKRFISKTDASEKFCFEVLNKSKTIKNNLIHWSK